MTPDSSPTSSPEAFPAVRSRAPRRPVWVFLGGLFVALLLAVLVKFDPESHSFYPRCLFRSLTGFDCPGCGGLRASHHLLRGEFSLAWSLNPLVVLLPWMVLLFGLIKVAKIPVPAVFRRRWGWIVLLLLLAFGVVRNLPLFRP